MTRRKTLPALILIFLCFQPWSCKKSPTTSTSPSPPGISASFNPASAGTDAALSFIITVTANSKEIRSFGGEAAFDARMLIFQGAAKGSLTGSWALVDANESSPGTLRLGGSAGSGPAVAVNSSGTLIEVRFKVSGGDYGNGRQDRVCLAQFTDDLTQFSSGEACAVFTLRK